MILGWLYPQRWSCGHEEPTVKLYTDCILCIVTPSYSGKESACNTGDPGSIHWSRRSPEGGCGNLLQYSCLENLMDREAWWATDHKVAKSRTWLSMHTFSLCIIYYTQISDCLWVGTPNLHVFKGRPSMSLSLSSLICLISSLSFFAEVPHWTHLWLWLFDWSLHQDIAGVFFLVSELLMSCFNHWDSPLLSL